MDFLPSYRIQKKLDYLCEQKELMVPEAGVCLGKPGRRELAKKGISGNRRDEPQERGSLDFMPWGIFQMCLACNYPLAI